MSDRLPVHFLYASVAQMTGALDETNLVEATKTALRLRPDVAEKVMGPSMSTAAVPSAVMLTISEEGLTVTFIWPDTASPAPEDQH